MTDRLSPSASPGGAGVRRVNNLPLVIVGGVMAGFLLIMAMVAVNRAHRKLDSGEKPKGGNASMFANSITSKYQGGIIPAAAPPTPKVEEKPALVVPVTRTDLDHPPAPPLPGAPPPKDQELERIKQIKLAAFEEAVKSPTSGQMAEFRSRAGNSGRPVDDPPHSAATPPPPPKLAASKADRWRLDSRPVAPETNHVLRTGFVIPAVMISGINSQLPGPVIAQVSQPVYDSATGRYLLIPQGTRLFGTYSNEVAAGQERVFVAWQRLIFPDGKAMDIGEMPGTDGAGLAGQTGDVNNHYLRIFGHALLMSLITAAATYSQQPHNVVAPGGFGYQQTASGTLSAALGQQLGAAGTAVLMKNLNIAPTIEVHAGYRLNVVATKDLTFDTPYRPFAK